MGDNYCVKEWGQTTTTARKNLLWMLKLLRKMLQKERVICISAHSYILSLSWKLTGGLYTN